MYLKDFLDKHNLKIRLNHVRGYEYQHTLVNKQTGDLIEIENEYILTTDECLSTFIEMIYRSDYKKFPPESGSWIEIKPETKLEYNIKLCI